jgi:biopolymer transport protein ExbD
MTWKVRHEGSPKAVEGLTLEQVVEGLLDGRWETSDEVQGPGETAWVPIEAHPQLEEAALEVEPEPPRTYDDETRLDMNALIDVCLVLLIFFILTTSYAALQKMMDAPSAGDASDPGSLRPVSRADAERVMISCKVTMENGQPVIAIEKEPTPRDKVRTSLERFVRNTNKTELLLEHDREVPYGTIVFIEDTAQKAGISRVTIGLPQPAR